MGKLVVVVVVAAGCAAAEVHTFTLREAVQRALAQNPDLTLARLDEQKAAQQVRVAKDPFIPKVFAGSGLAYSSGFPMSIEGSAPAVIQARAVASVVNRQQHHRLAQAREDEKRAALDTLARRDEIICRTVELYLEAELAARSVKTARAQVEGLEKVAETVRLRVEEGRELPLEARRAEFDIAKARQRVEAYASELISAETSLASVLGFGPGDRVRAAAEERDDPQLPESEETAVGIALEDNPQVRRLESALLAKGFEVKAEKAARLPRLDLVAQYGLFSRFNNYEDFFRRFQRHNGQIGVSFEIPIFTGAAADARAAQAAADVTRLRVELDSTRNRIALEAGKSYREVETAETAGEVARLDLELARENLSILLARFQEGRASLREIEAARFLENEKWIAFYQARHDLEIARYRLLHRTGGLLALFR